jgi:oligosaccharide repeat unit polymerase
LTLWAAGRPKTLFDLGFVVLCIFGGYYLLPSIIAQFADLAGREIESERIALLMEYGTGFVLAFSISYLVFVRWALRTNISLPGQRVCRKGDWKLALGLFLGFEAMHVAIGAYYIDLSSDYIVTYAQAQAIPDGIRHIYSYMAILSMVAEIVLLRALKVASVRLERWLLVVLTVVHLAQTLVTQSRQYFVRFLIMLVFQTGLNQRRGRVPMIIQVAGVGIFVVLLNVMAMIRGMNEGADMSGVAAVDVLVPSEFITVYLNAYLLAGLRLEDSIVQPPGVPYLADLIAFVPAAFAPWTKTDLSTWFVKEYFPDYAAQGGGLAFGTLAEAIVYFGWLSVFLQAVALGGFLGVLSGIAKKRTERFPLWFSCLYLYNAMWIYSPIRTTTFSLLGGMVHGFIVPYFVCRTLMRVLPHAFPRRVAAPVETA